MSYQVFVSDRVTLTNFPQVFFFSLLNKFGSSCVLLLLSRKKNGERKKRGGVLDRACYGTICTHVVVVPFTFSAATMFSSCSRTSPLFLFPCASLPRLLSSVISICIIICAILRINLNELSMSVCVCVYSVYILEKGQPSQTQLHVLFIQNVNMSKIQYVRLVRIYDIPVVCVCVCVDIPFPSPILRTLSSVSYFPFRKFFSN